MLALCGASGPQRFLFQGPLGAVSQADQRLDSLGQSTQSLIFHDELRRTQWILGREEERSYTYMRMFLTHFCVATLNIVAITGSFSPIQHYCSSVTPPKTLQYVYRTRYIW